MQAHGPRTVPILLIAFVLIAGTATAAPMTTLVVVEPSLTSNRALIEVGIAQGIFEKYGLRLQIRPAASGQAAVAQAREADFIGASGPSVLCQTVAQGTRLKAMFVTLGDATGGTRTGDFVAVIAGRAGGIRAGHLEDLRGKRVGLSRLTDAHTYYWYALAAKGLDPVTTATIVDLPPTAIPRALQSGTVDAVVVWEPVVAQTLQAAGGSIVVQRGGPTYPFMQFRSVSPQYLATHPGTIKRYITAWAETALYVRMHRDAAAGVLIADFGDLNPVAVRAGAGYMNPDLRVSKATVHWWQLGCEFAVKVGVAKQTPAFKDVFDYRLLRQVERERPYLFKDLPPIPEALKL